LGGRGEIVITAEKITSPDGAFVFQALPLRSFSFANNPMMLRSIRAGAQAGGWAVNQPSNTSQFVDGYARMELRAQAGSIRLDEAATA
jgi:hypothetical protein